MMKVLLFIALILPLPATAANPFCSLSSFYDGFSGQFPPPPLTTYQTTGFIYGLDETELYVTFANGAIAGYQNVPLQTASSFNYASNPDTFYSSQILPLYAKSCTCGTLPLN